MIVGYKKKAHSLQKDYSMIHYFTKSKFQRKCSRNLKRVLRWTAECYGKQFCSQKIIRDPLQGWMLSTHWTRSSYAI